MSKKVKVPGRASSLGITERKQAEEALRESEEKYREIVETSIDMIATVAPNGGFLLMNKAWKECFGYSGDKMKVFDVIHPEDLEAARERFIQVLEGQSVENFEFRSKTKEGSYINLLINILPIFDSQRNVVTTLGIAKDITERKRMEHILNERVKELQCLYSIAYIVERPGITLDELYQEMVNLLPAGWRYPEITCARVTLGDKEYRTDNFRTTEWKQSANIKIKGQKGGILEVCYLEDRPEFAEEPFSKEERLLIDVVAQRLGRITERERMEKQLQESEENFHRSLDDSPLGVRIFNSEGETLYANQAILDIYGYASVEEFKAIPTEKRLTPESYAEHLIRREKRLRGEGISPQFEMSIVRKDGEIRHLQVFRKEVLWNGERRVQSLYQDITERKRAEKTLQESEERYRALLELGGEVGEAIVMTQDTEQGNGIQAFVSDEWPRITGYSRRELLGMPFFDLVHPKHHEASLERHRRKMRGEDMPGLFELSIIRKDGTEVPIELTSAYTTYKGKRANVAYIRDITERKRMERELQERNEQLDAQNEELQSRAEELMTQQQELIEKTGEVERANQLKSEFLANMSHGLRTPLNVIIGFSELMGDEVPGKLNDEQRQCLDDIQSSGKHLLNLINKVLDLSKVESGRTKLNLTNLALTEVIESLARTMLPILAPRQQGLDVKVEEGLPLVYADKVKVKEVLLNLLSNAARFTPDGGKLKIEAVREDNWCRVSVIDNGIGIKKEDQKKIFEPFCQLDNPLTKGRGGTGLGLALVKQIIEKHGGQVRVESEYGRGSRFTFTLPLATTA